MNYFLLQNVSHHLTYLLEMNSLKNVMKISSVVQLSYQNIPSIIAALLGEPRHILAIVVEIYKNRGTEARFFSSCGALL